jgi:hypothetical protein
MAREDIVDLMTEDSPTPTEDVMSDQDKMFSSDLLAAIFAQNASDAAWTTNALDQSKTKALKELGAMYLALWSRISKLNDHVLRSMDIADLLDEKYDDYLAAQRAMSATAIQED